MNKLRIHFPPLGFLVALLTAILTGWAAVPDTKAGAVLAEVVDTPFLAKAALEGLGGPADSVVAANITALSEQPLFAQGRQLPSPRSIEPIDEPTTEELTPEEPAPMEIQPPEIHLIGVLRRSGKTQALVRNASIGTEDWVAEGDVIQEWTVVAISQNEIRLALGGTEFAVQMYQD